MPAMKVIPGLNQSLVIRLSGQKPQIPAGHVGMQ